jgi:alpha-N-arabinofuranosidase
MRLASALKVLWSAFILAGVAFAQKEPASKVKPVVISVSTSHPLGFKVPRTIFGTFLEPIGKSTYGGLWAEELTNPSFEDGLWSAGRVAAMIRERPELSRASELGLPLPWEPLDYQQGNRYEPRWNDAANSYRSLFLMGLPSKETGIRQEVYLPVHRELRYTGSIYVKHVGGPPTLQVSIREQNHPEHVLASSSVELHGDGWEKYSYKLEIPAGKLWPLNPADFVISVTNETRVLLDQASLMPEDAISGMDPDMIAMSRAIKTPLVRFGGNFTSAYHWKDGVGPIDKRVSMLNIAWGIPEYNSFGTDEFLEFCRLIGAEPQIALNLGTGTPEEAAEWVKYVNTRWGDRSGGLLWELGNELWGDFQVGYPTIERVADRTSMFSEAVKAVDPKARLIGTGGDPDWFPEWNAKQLTNASSAFNYLSTHFVVGDADVVNKNASPDFIAQAVFALPVALERKLKEMHEQVQNGPGKDVIKTAFTEWLFHAPHGRVPRYDNMGGAVAASGFLNMLMRNADIVPISDMTGLVEFGGIWKKRGRVFGTPAYYAFSLYSNADISQPLQVETDSLTYDVSQGVRRLPEVPGVPYVDVVAALNDKGDKLTLFCVNRHVNADFPLEILLDGFTAGSAHAKSLFSDTIYDVNDEVNPEAVVPRPQTVSVKRRNVSINLRHESVTVIELNKKM